MCAESEEQKWLRARRGRHPGDVPHGGEATTDVGLCDELMTLLAARHDGVVKNQSLGFEVPYPYGSETRMYRPGFIVRARRGTGALRRGLKRESLFKRRHGMAHNLTKVLRRVAALALATPSCLPLWGCSHEASCSDLGPPKDTAATSQQACDIAARGDLASRAGASANPTFFGVCDVCDSVAPGSKYAYTDCTLSSDYVAAFFAAQPADGGANVTDGGATSLDDAADACEDAGVLCPTVQGPVKVTCYIDCSGRRTAGAREPAVVGRLGAGQYFARCAYLESVSIHAFLRLSDELKEHGAPAALIAAAKHAALEEVRHAEVMGALARRFGVEPEVPKRLPRVKRSLVALALENAVEGCVRETFGAALALVSADRATLSDMRLALLIIARDECGHAELSWDVARWLWRRLNKAARARVRRAMKKATRELAFTGSRLEPDARAICGVPSAEGLRRLAHLLDEHVYRSAA